MNTIYKTQMTVHADVENVWDAITQQRFVKDFFPEIKKDLSNLSDYVFRTHKNTERLLPAYMLPNHVIGWAKGGATDIRLPRKDVNANIKTIDIELIAKGENTKIKIEVDYSPKFDKNFFLAHRCVRGLMEIKLAILKQEIEANNNQGWTSEFA